MMTGDVTSRRLDVELVQRGLAPSRAQAREAIETGKVTVNGVLATKAGQVVSDSALIEAIPLHPWVSRGGIKLAHALDVFKVDPAGRHCLDIGSSTGGFTDVLLSRGARRVVAVDVGSGQLHPRLRDDPRVISLETTDARSLAPDAIIEPPTLLVCDASFIGLAKLLAVPLSLAAPDARLVALFKPQFEVGRENIGKGGIVTDLAATDAAAQALTAWLDQAGWAVRAWTDSPIAGGDGNRERLFLAARM
jgi:23S rRNA (cytidine1920-2'-O)/16S rRNA (cytidine1409-2'-O)-methyltransferase